MGFLSRRGAAPSEAPDGAVEPTGDISPASSPTEPPPGTAISPEPGTAILRDPGTTIPPEPEPAPVQPAPVATKKRSFFLRRRPESPSGSSSASSELSGGDYHSTRAGTPPCTAPPESDAPPFSHAGSFSRKRTLHRTFGHGSAPAEVDPSIAAARDRVMSAEAAERDADQALAQARARVREAREHVRRIEEEAKEEARRAVIKHQQAREVMRRGKGLGRHGAN